MYSIKETAVCWNKKKNLYKCLSNVHCFRAPRTSVPLWCFKSVSSRKWVFHRSLDCPLFWKKLYRSCGVSVGPMYIICIVIFWGILLIFVETKTLKRTKLSSETQLNDMIKSDGPEIKTVLLRLCLFSFVISLLAKYWMQLGKQKNFHILQAAITVQCNCG